MLSLFLLIERCLQHARAMIGERHVVILPAVPIYWLTPGPPRSSARKSVTEPCADARFWAAWARRSMFAQHLTSRSTQAATCSRIALDHARRNAAGSIMVFIPEKPMSTTTDAFVEQNRDRLLDELKEFLRIPSISTLPEHRADIDRAAQFVADSLRHAGMENVEIIPTANHPLVYADWLHAPGKPTVLCYGHYDVQPADPLEDMEHPALRARRSRRQHLRPRHRRRQGPDVHARQGRRSAARGRTARCPST